MLPVYRAHSFQKILPKGGRTKPWLVLVNEGSTLVPYVVKMFSAELVQKRDSVLNEVLGNLLAKEFDLPVPKAALIEMDQDFYMTINDIDAIDVYDFVDDRIKFGTRLISPSFDFQPGAFSTQELKNIIDIDTVFAFDHLIRNGDRTNNNPNLQVSGDSFYLIDHDLGFQIDEETTKEVTSIQLGGYLGRYHIFYEHLHSSRIKKQQHYFETFEEYLRLLDLNNIFNACNQLLNYGFSGSRHSLLKNYLKNMKCNSSKFVTLTRGMIG